LETKARSGSGATFTAPPSSDAANDGWPICAKSCSALSPATLAGSNAADRRTYTQPVTIVRNSAELAEALPCTSPSWLPREEYHGTSRPAAVKGCCARSSSPG
jgi:hypothetical protein